MRWLHIPSAFLTAVALNVVKRVVPTSSRELAQSEEAQATAVGAKQPVGTGKGNSHRATLQAEYHPVTASANTSHGSKHLLNINLPVNSGIPWIDTIHLSSEFAELLQYIKINVHARNLSPTSLYSKATQITKELPELRPPEDWHSPAMPPTASLNGQPAH
ncbi:hypothetical protein LTR84_001367 [Exophiala bonariae]|uniref:Uncharacterized protein n=1 Tax=Exophiala bonariae TaxID=1690606 RepID=A0AAV9NG49_9EURO|nr:hypothetical protein LTR84_001367 [Exophiala bonariae]